MVPMTPMGRSAHSLGELGGLPHPSIHLAPDGLRGGRARRSARPKTVQKS